MNDQYVVATIENPELVPGEYAFIIEGVELYRGADSYGNVYDRADVYFKLYREDGWIIDYTLKPIISNNDNSLYRTFINDVAMASKTQGFYFAQGLIGASGRIRLKRVNKMLSYDKILSITMPKNSPTEQFKKLKR